MVEEMEVRRVVGMLEVWLFIEDVVDWAREVEMSVDRMRIWCKTLLRVCRALELSSISPSGPNSSWCRRIKGSKRLRTGGLEGAETR